MDSQVIPQADVGSLSVRGLSAFMPVLAALSADDVVPTAVVQLEQLGSLFHISGPYAAKVPDLLQRCSSTRLDRIGLIIGWRKGDTASIISQTAGGQAIALLCFWLRNNFSEERSGEILYCLCERIVPQQFLVSSVAQIAHVAHLLFSKLAALGFGNILARQISRVADAYRQLGLEMPKDFFEILTTEATVDLLSAISSALCEEDTIVTISGTQGLASIISIVSILFPEDTALILETFILQEGLRRKIIMISNSQDPSFATVQIRTERQLHGSPSQWLPLHIDKHKYYTPQLGNGNSYTFNWERHVAESLQLEFASVGLNCPQKLLVACSNLIMAIGPRFNRPGEAPINSEFEIPGFRKLLGSNAPRRLRMACHSLLGVSPSSSQIDIQQAFVNILFSFEEAVCSAYSCPSVPSSPSWQYHRSGGKTCEGKTCSAKDCIPKKLWLCLGHAIARVLQCSLIYADLSAPISFRLTRKELFGQILEDVIRISPGNDNCGSWPSQDSIHAETLGILISDSNNFRYYSRLAVSNKGSTIYPTCFRRLKLDIDEGFSYELHPGHLIFKNRYHDEILCGSRGFEEPAEKPISTLQRPISPTAIGEHSSIFFSIREQASVLELRTNVSVLGQTIQLPFAGILRRAMALEDADPCEHDALAEFDASSCDDIIVTSVAAPTATWPLIAIAQTKGNETAQLLACRGADHPILQRHCCLECAVNQARREDRKQVIVGV